MMLRCNCQMLLLVVALLPSSCQVEKSAFYFQHETAVTTYKARNQTLQSDSLSGVEMIVDNEDVLPTEVVQHSNNRRYLRKLHKSGSRVLLIKPIHTIAGSASLLRKQPATIMQQHSLGASKDYMPRALQILGPYLVFFAVLFALPLCIGLIAELPVVTLIGAIGLGIVAIITAIFAVQDLRG